MAGLGRVSLAIRFANPVCCSSTSLGNGPCNRGSKECEYPIRLKRDERAQPRHGANIDGSLGAFSRRRPNAQEGTHFGPQSRDSWRHGWLEMANSTIFFTSCARRFFGHRDIAWANSSITASALEVDILIPSDKHHGPCARLLKRISLGFRSFFEFARNAHFLMISPQKRNADHMARTFAEDVQLDYHSEGLKYELSVRLDLLEPVSENSTDRWPYSDPQKAVSM